VEHLKSSAENLKRLFDGGSEGSASVLRKRDGTDLHVLVKPHSPLHMDHPTLAKDFQRLPTLYQISGELLNKYSSEMSNQIDKNWIKFTSSSLGYTISFNHPPEWSSHYDQHNGKMFFADQGFHIPVPF
jgi:hypothetical protein